MGIQELLLHFHPTFGAVIIPALTLAALVALPYLRNDMEDSTGVWFRSARGRRLVLISLPVGVLSTAAFVVINEYWLDITSSLSFVPTSISYGVAPLGIGMAGVLGYGRLLCRRGAARSETRMALFTLVLAAFITLTVIGVFFRGENMALEFPWEVSP
jgi:hypothetical protein